jgi:8-oxo-dGTP pyrophosphatase MutT (NUDIX family)
MKATAKQAMDTIRESASLLVVAPKNNILFMLRPKRGTFPAAHVFPGGGLDDDDPNLAYCALRETYEETGLLIVPRMNKVEVHEPGKVSFADAVLRLTGSSVSQLDWSNDCGLARVSRWTTPPEISKRRFRTQFFVYQSREKFEFPTFEKSNEVEKLEWLQPHEAIEAFKAGGVSLMPPQFFLMTRIQRYGLAATIQSLKDRDIQPKRKKVFEDKRLQLDWGYGESGIITFGDKNSILDIEYVNENGNESKL